MHNLKKTGVSEIPVVILCGGKGMRVAGTAKDLPKPLLKIGQRPILWHVMKIYASQGYRRFILCLGYRGNQIRSYFKKNNPEHWQITYIDTGLRTSKSERIARVNPLIKEENFFLAYGDDVADINLDKLLRFHLKTGSIVTITAVKMFSIFGVVEIGKGAQVVEFKEKPYLKKWMNGGFMVMSSKIFHYLNRGELENEVFEDLTRKKKISAYKHSGRWKTMNTLKDNLELNVLWREGRAFWKRW